MFGTLFLGGAVMGGLWVARLRTRSEHGRRLAIDDEGVTYCTAWGGCRSLRWGEIESVIESASQGEEYTTYSLTIRGHGRRFGFDDADLAGCEEIRALLRERIPERVRLHPDYA